jgi:hypothetical protein
MTPEQIAKSGSEHSHQVALFAWCNMAARYGVEAANNNRSYTEPGFAVTLNNISTAISQLNLLFAIHNQGHGDKIRGSIAKAEGVKAGVPDLMLPVAMPNPNSRFMYHGLFIEMKKIKVGKVSEDQIKWLTDLRNQGYKTCVCAGWQESRDCLLEYLLVK